MRRPADVSIGLAGLAQGKPLKLRDLVTQVAAKLKPGETGEVIAKDPGGQIIVGPYDSEFWGLRELQDDGTVRETYMPYIPPVFPQQVKVVDTTRVDVIDQFPPADELSSILKSVYADVVEQAVNEKMSLLGLFKGPQSNRYSDQERRGRTYAEWVAREVDRRLTLEERARFDRPRAYWPSDGGVLEIGSPTPTIITRTITTDRTNIEPLSGQSTGGFEWTATEWMLGQMLIRTAQPCPKLSAMPPPEFYAGSFDFSGFCYCGWPIRFHGVQPGKLAGGPCRKEPIARGDICRRCGFLLVQHQRLTVGRRYFDE